MHTVNLDDDVFAGLQKYAVPMVDDTNSVIRKLLRWAQTSSFKAVGDRSMNSGALPAAVNVHKRERTLHTLLRKEVVTPGTRLVLDKRQVQGPSPVPLTDRRLRCSVGSVPRARQNVVWDDDGKSYSLSALTEKLRDDCGVPLTRGALNGYLFWCLESSPGKSLWDLAEENERS
jgi:hypothetical protein